MLRKTDGFFLSEILLSLSIWFLITLFLLPLLIYLRDQSIKEQLKNTALHLVYDELERKIDEGIIDQNRIVTLNGNSFEIKWTDDTSQTEVCVEYKDVKTGIQKICKTPE
jgi:competence protein ComGE